jgi:hypothetical protein
MTTTTEDRIAELDRGARELDEAIVALDEAIDRINRAIGTDEHPLTSTIIDGLLDVRPASRLVLDVMTAIDDYAVVVEGRG